METKFKINDVVIFKAKPNSGQMIITKIKDKPSKNYPNISDDNPLITAKFWNESKKRYDYGDFYAFELILVIES